MNKKIKAVYFSLVLVLQSGEVGSHIISAHRVRFFGLTYLAVQTFDYACPAQPAWTLYNVDVSATWAFMCPLFTLVNAALNPVRVTHNPLGEAPVVGTLTGMLTVPASYLSWAAECAGRYVLPAQQVTFEVLQSMYFDESGPILPTIREE